MKAAEFHQARKFADTTFGRIAYVEQGSGPVALFVHGFPLNGFVWRGCARRSGRDPPMYRARFDGVGPQLKSPRRRTSASASKRK